MPKRTTLFICALLICSLAACAPTANDPDPLDFPSGGPQAQSENAGDAPQPSEDIQEKGFVDPNRTYTYEMMLADANELTQAYPGLVKVSSIGKSVEGRDLTLLQIGKGETKLLLLGAHHAREYITSTFLMETADAYAGTYEAGTENLLDSVTVYIVPMVNPDGVNLVQNGPDAAKDPQAVKAMRMLKDSYSEWKANINGVDLNRQYPCHWEEKASNTDVPSSEMYKGTAAATEPEVQAVMKLCGENAFAMAASFHTKGEVIYWADSGTEDAIEAAAPIAQSIAEATGYALMEVSGDPAVYGAGFENWFRQEYLRPGFCIELTPVGNGSLPHEDAQFDALVWDRAKGLTTVLMQQALTLGEEVCH
ncbi:MAG TPA: M14 family zinc carboxypeptidase [Feifaniaceae bacterium]|nr:M14 family zinc carboxypeptidase [Feifaniaceae bacterium]